METHIKMSSESPSAEMADMSTPSPGEMPPTTPNTSVSGTSNSNANASTLNPSSGTAPRRPPRKSTLTQQQKNQKRQRATQDQLVTLEMEFSKNPTPNAAVRERIASDISMTERSVQIWFQNRYLFSPGAVEHSLTLA